MKALFPRQDPLGAKQEGRRAARRDEGGLDRDRLLRPRAVGIHQACPHPIRVGIGAGGPPIGGAVARQGMEARAAAGRHPGGTRTIRMKPGPGTVSVWVPMTRPCASIQ